MSCYGNFSPTSRQNSQTRFDFPFLSWAFYSWRAFAAYHFPSSMRGLRFQWLPLAMQSLTRFHNSPVFALCFNPGHFIHRFNCSIVLIWTRNPIIFSRNRKRLSRTTRDCHILIYCSLRIGTLSSLFVWVTVGCPNSWRHLCAAQFDNYTCLLRRIFIARNSQPLWAVRNLSGLLFMTACQ